MPTLLYLDSARMGLMSERAHLAQLDYTRLAAAEGSSLYFDAFLHEGFEAWPRELQSNYRHLSDWRGILELKSSLQALVGQPAETPVLLANRTAQLVAMAARLLAERCTRILLCDLAWPSYRRILERARVANRVGITTVGLRQAALDGCLSQQDLVRRVASHYEQMSCDGLFLPAVSHDGVRLPLDSICRAIRRIRSPQLSVVDGAQAFCHVPSELGLDTCDIFIAGCHKWLQGHVPMGVAYLPQRQSAARILSTVNFELLTGELDDPLLSFSRHLETGDVKLFSETVSLASLFACRAALADEHRSPRDIAEQFAHRRLNARRVEDLASALGWASLCPQYGSGIVMLQVDRLLLRSFPANRVRKFFLRHGISLSCYDDGVVRLAMPERPLSDGQLDLLGWALEQFRQEDWIVGDLEADCTEAVGLA